MSKTNQSVLEVSDSLTGFDEAAVTQHFGRPVSDLMDKDSSMWARSLVFVLLRRDGASDDDARNAVMAMTIKDVSGFFADESEESGKDEPESEPQPESSQPSAS
jgi:hypothetical protein